MTWRGIKSFGVQGLWFRISGSGFRVLYSIAPGAEYRGLPLPATLLAASVAAHTHTRKHTQTHTYTYTYTHTLAHTPAMLLAASVAAHRSWFRVQGSGHSAWGMGPSLHGVGFGVCRV